MKIEDVKNLPVQERFLYWIKERHQIYLKRRAGRSKPWTDDVVLQSNFFTNPYRENDKVTVWFRETIRNPLRNNPAVIMATVIFRWFNLPQPTGELLWNYGTDKEGVGDLLTCWNRRIVLRELGRRRDRGEKIFTGAFMVNSPPGKPKLEAICDRIQNVWKDRKSLVTDLEAATTLQEAHQRLTRYEGLGGFMAYEVICDLYHTYVLENATDIDTWSNPGPGAVRGLSRILGLEFDASNNSSSPPCPKDYQEQTKILLSTVRDRFTRMPRFDMRVIEHSLCEFDKYERLLWGQGKSKRKYKGI